MFGDAVLVLVGVGGGEELYFKESVKCEICHLTRQYLDIFPIIHPIKNYIDLVDAGR